MASTVKFFCVCLLVATQSFLTKGDLVLPMEYLNECIKEKEFSGNLLKMNMDDPHYPHEAKCIFACGLEKNDLVKSDGSLNRETAIAFKEKKEKPDQLEKTKVRLDNCIKTVKVVPDKCETAFSYVKCMVQ